MAKRITSITPQQQKELEGIRDEWIAYGLSIEPANRPAAEEGINLAYRAAGIDPPGEIVWVDSPLAGAKYVKERGLTPSALQNIIYGQHWAGYYSWLAAAEHIGVTGLELIHGQQQVARNAGWWWPFDELTVVTERPNSLSRDPQGRLHHETGMALSYPDGWGVYSWHGTRVPADLITEGWDTRRIFEETNQEVRRCAIERLGWDVFIDQSGMKIVGSAVEDPGNPGQTIALYDLPSELRQDLYGEPVRVLLVTNATLERDGTRRRFGLTVPEEIDNPVNAAAWTFDLPPETYNQLARAC